MKKISAGTLINEMCNNEIYMLYDGDNGYCDWMMICIADGSLTCCPAWEADGELRFCTDESKAIQYTQVDMEYVDSTLTVAELLAVMSDWYEGYMDVSQECACPGFRVFDVSDEPETVMTSGYRTLPQQDCCELALQSVDEIDSEYDR